MKDYVYCNHRDERKDSCYCNQIEGLTSYKVRKTLTYGIYIVKPIGDLSKLIEEMGKHQFNLLRMDKCL
jgi:hypothetical protein